MSGNTPAAQVIMAAAQGARAAVIIDQELLFADAYGSTADTRQAAPRSPEAPGTASPQQ